MRLNFRQRIFFGLVALGTVPLGIALLALALEVRSTGSSVGPRAALDEVAQSGRVMIATLDTIELSDTTRATLRRHTETIARSTNLARRAETLSRFAAGILGGLIFLAAAILIAASLNLARRWSAYFSAPMDELTRWIGLIRKRAPLPEPVEGNSIPEFATVRSALREMSEALDAARKQEVERERLLAFREIARRVAHEIRGPLTASRLALAQLSKRNDAATRSGSDEIGVLQDELERLEGLAIEFAEFGRLPEGPEAPVDIAELLDSVIPATVPKSVSVQHHADSEMVVQGHYEPLRRAVQNLLRNAVEATDARGIEVTATRSGTADPSSILLRVSDHGPGVPQDRHGQIFEPYYTTKRSGTGLGLAIVKQTVVSHGGTVAIQDTPGGGATFIVELPAKL